MKTTRRLFIGLLAGTATPKIGPPALLVPRKNGKNVLMAELASGQARMVEARRFSIGEIARIY